MTDHTNHRSQMKGLFQSLLPSSVASVVFHALVLSLTVWGARGCQSDMQAKAGGEKYRHVGLAQLPTKASERDDSLRSEAVDGVNESLDPPIPDVNSAVPDQLPNPFKVLDQQQAVEANSESMNMIGPGTPLASQILDPPLRRLPSAGSVAGGGSPTPDEGDTSFLGIEDSGERFVYIIDTSGSMHDGGRLGLARSQLISSLNMLQPHQQFQVIFYGDSALQMMIRKRRGMHAATLPNLNAAAGQIQQVNPAGGTSHLPALSLAFQLKPDVVYFLTDGRNASHSNKQFQETLRENSSGARIHVIEFASGPPESRDPTWLHQLAGSTGGRYRRVQLDGE